MVSTASTPLQRIATCYGDSVINNEPITVADQNATLIQGTTKVQGKIRVTQTWSPMSIAWEFEPPDPKSFDFDDVRICSPQIKAKGRIYSIGTKTISGYIQGHADLGTDYPIDRATFHLANYPDLSSGSFSEEIVTDGDGRGTTIRWCEIRLEAEGWIIKLQPHPKIVEMRRSANPVLSGVGEICKSDHSEFKKKELAPILEAIRVFLSFAFAQWTAPLLVVGANSKSTKACEIWGNYEIGQPTYLQGWLDERHGDCLSNYFPHFMKAWRRPDWQEPLTLAVTWLVEASRQAGGLDGAIAFAQIPLEMLAWLVFVEDTNILDGKDFEKIPAFGKIQMLLSHCGIPFTVPMQLPALTKVRDGKRKPNLNDQTGPTLITNIRNNIIHPDAGNRKSLQDYTAFGIKVEDIRWESYRLFKWYLTLVLLRLTGYSGKYANHLTRRSIGQVEDVPWVK